jgi:hypothetical protein
MMPLSFGSSFLLNLPPAEEGTGNHGRKDTEGYVAFIEFEQRVKVIRWSGCGG